ncbi:YSIRK-type signal peptide-containing protein [Aerococcaceae bacterium zg-BR9]|uniref:Ig-like domain-containing protein n=1 Tax=Aerococcaceae bacterium zg-1292 TaxID=2774330 RepID=UPI004063B37F|nr:YSIRK-type signal peptide-containing protein [Aerococcaceae bacterium zg-BR9]
MLGKNNINERERKAAIRKRNFGYRKYSFGLASVAVSAALFFMSPNALADVKAQEMDSESPQSSQTNENVDDEVPDLGLPTEEHEASVVEPQLAAEEITDSKEEVATESNEAAAAEVSKAAESESTTETPAETRTEVTEAESKPETVKETTTEAGESVTEKPKDQSTTETTTDVDANAEKADENIPNELYDFLSKNHSSIDFSTKEAYLNLARNYGLSVENNAYVEQIERTLKAIRKSEAEKGKTETVNSESVLPEKLPLPGNFSAFADAIANSNDPKQSVRQLLSEVYESKVVDSILERVDFSLVNDPEALYRNIAAAGLAYAKENTKPHVFAANVTDKVKLTSLTATSSTATRPNGAVHLTEGDHLKVKAEFSVADTVKKGDTTTVDYGKYVQPGGLTYPAPIVPMRISVDGKYIVIAEGVYDPQTNKVTYTFNEKVEEYTGIKGFIQQVASDRRENYPGNKQSVPNDFNFFGET